MSLLNGLSLLFFAVFSICAFLGIYVLFLNLRNTLHHLFFLVCLSMGIWALSFSMVNSTQYYELALFWRRIAVLGWGTFFSFLMHFLIILTEKRDILKKWWIYLLIYVPAGLLVYVFGPFGDLARGQYHLVNTAVGWVNISVNNGWDWFSNISYIVFTIIGLCLLLKWEKNSKEPEKKKQAHILIISFATVVILGTITEIVVNTYTPFRIPQMAPIIALIPITAIYYAIKMYGLLAPEKSQETEPGKILNKAKHGQLYQIMSIMFVIGGLLNFASQYYFNAPSFVSVLIFSMVLFIIGLVLQIIRIIPIKEELRDTFLMLVIAVSIPVITLRFIEFGSLTVWAAPFVFVMLSVVFNQRRMLYGICISILLTQIWVWIKVPTVMVQVDAADHIVRVSLFCITIWMAYYVNRIYVHRLEENEAQIRFQKMVSKISSDLITVNESNMEDKINLFLKMSGEHFQADHTCFVSMSENLKTYEWCGAGIEPVIDSIPDMTGDTLPWWIKRILSSGVTYIPDVEMMEPEACKEKTIFRTYHIKSLISIPMMRKDKKMGFLFYSSASELSISKGDDQELLGILANLLSDALQKVEAEKEISYMAYYDSLTKLPNRTLFKNRLDQAIHLAKRSEKLIGVIFIDLDSFKSVNDTIGHFGGDELLRQVADRLYGCLRKHEIMAQLNKSFITPIDREDINLIARVLDNIVDEIESTAHRFLMFNVTTIRDDVLEIASAIVEGTNELLNVMLELKNMKKSKNLIDKIIEVNRIENVGDTLYRKAMTNLFQSEKDAIEVIKWKEIYQYMEHTLDACEDVANIVEGVVMKNV